ncbi:universal stress protein [Zobellella sp. CGMCC 1.18722]|uniref:Universal stress protein n=1 Tax=Zobellella iuensis TaxID=2803811 RepID=A0ABS1QQM8_9GAMM|nr:universal stress protein [Zobellella iuensis]
MTQLMACIDGSRQAGAVCDLAGWASLRLSAPLTLLHVLDQSQYIHEADFSGYLGLEGRRELLQELSRLDERRSRLAVEQGKLILAAARERVLAAGVTRVECLQRHGALVDNLAELEQDERLLVLGAYGEQSSESLARLGSQVEQVVRALHQPMLVAQPEFRTPQKAMLAYDGSAGSRRGLALLAQSPLLQGLELHLLLVGKIDGEHRALLEEAQALLTQAGVEAFALVLPGEPELVLPRYQQDNGIDLMVMGAYGHSRLRRWLLGSTTTAMLRTIRVPLLVLR